MSSDPTGSAVNWRLQANALIEAGSRAFLISGRVVAKPEVVILSASVQFVAVVNGIQFGADSAEF